VDAVTAAVFRISRQKASDLVTAERIFINGQTVLSAGKGLKAGDRVSVRGSGKYIYDGISGSSRKGRLFADIRMFV
jgi:RNA-binding protein YlmH